MSPPSKTVKKNLEEVISDLEIKLSIAKSENNYQRIVSLKNIIKALKRKGAKKLPD